MGKRARQPHGWRRESSLSGAYHEKCGKRYCAEVGTLVGFGGKRGQAMISLSRRPGNVEMYSVVEKGGIKAAKKLADRALKRLDAGKKSLPGTWRRP